MKQFQTMNFLCPFVYLIFTTQSDIHGVILNDTYRNDVTRMVKHKK